MIYLDNAATTNMRDSVIETMNRATDEYYGNPSSIHRFGHIVEKRIQESRQVIADELGVSANEIFFTPGGTYSNNIANQGILLNHKPGNVISTTIEHSSVYQIFQKYNGKKEVRWIPANPNGTLPFERLDQLIDADTQLVSIMQVNNELGTIQAIHDIGEKIKTINPNTLFHVDGVQGFGKFPLKLRDANIDLYSMSAHKIHGPKGIGALYVRRGVHLIPLYYGGGQEGGYAPGTQNTIAIIGFQKALEELQLNRDEESNRIQSFNRTVRDGIKSIEGHQIHSPEDASPYIINVGFSQCKSEVLVHLLEQQGIMISTGSACNKNKKSRILEAIGVDERYVDGSVRISFGCQNKMDEIQHFLDLLKQSVSQIRAIMGG